MFALCRTSSGPLSILSKPQLFIGGSHTEKRDEEQVLINYLDLLNTPIEAIAFPGQAESASFSTRMPMA